jgi:hypothetical protein
MYVTHPTCCETKVRGLDTPTVAQSRIYMGVLLPEAWFWVAARLLTFPKHGLERIVYLWVRTKMTSFWLESSQFILILRVRCIQEPGALFKAPWMSLMVLSNSVCWKNWLGLLWGYYSGYETGWLQLCQAKSVQEQDNDEKEKRKKNVSLHDSNLTTVLYVYYCLPWLLV